MEISDRKKEIYKLKLISLIVLIFSSLYLFDEEVSYMKIGFVIFVMSNCCYLILNTFKYYIETGQKFSSINGKHFLFFRVAFTKSELYNDILTIMLLLAYLISLCLVIFGIYLILSEILQT